MWEKTIHKWLRVPYTLHVRLDRRSKRARATVLFLHGIGNTGAAWDKVIETLPDNVRLVTIDLLGFGDSRQPRWATYDAKIQARAILATYLKLRIAGQVIIVGHSLGALIAVEMTKRYPILVKGLVLCGPPFYRTDEAKRKLIPSADRLLKEIFTLVKNHPDQFLKIAALATKLGLVNPSFDLTKDTADTYMSALEASIINQTSLQDALKLQTPTTILYGKLDAVVVTKNLRYLADNNQHIHVESLIGSHEVTGTIWIRKVKDTIEKHLS